MVRKCVAEMIGTFALVFAGTGAVVVNDVSGGTVTHVGVALTFGLVVMAMIYAVGDVSGAHLNPAVTCGFWLAGRLGGCAALPYILSQVVGGLAVLTALLMFVILSVSVGPKEKGLMAGIAVGGTIALEAMFAGPICGASMNPARSLAPALVSGQVTHLWLYLAAPVLGAAAAVPCWQAVYGEKCNERQERLL